MLWPHTESYINLANYKLRSSISIAILDEQRQCNPKTGPEMWVLEISWIIMIYKSNEIIESHDQTTWDHMQWEIFFNAETCKIKHKNHCSIPGMI